MPIYFGKSEDGSDMQEFDEGVYVDPHNPKIWSTEPYPGQRRILNLKNTVYNYMNDNHYTLDDVYKEIINKKCKLPLRYRKYVLKHYDKNGNFIKKDE